ncbi:DUF2306 domain-containing protein [Tenacibaculum holothuriorum]|uniref:DUF2306 domain-containing protein n=1 Tax=Tenacibaculum holothuriorum TaxID=1635173 RepID=UPI000A32509F|nr:DUF2306 domain-containing protein [Tenacibaculum holothuriorum]
MKKNIAILLWILFGGLCVFYSTYPLKYILTNEPILLLSSKAISLLNSNFYLICFYLHIIFGGIALLIGWVQFIEKFRKRYINIHRWIGKIYIASILLSGIPGFYIAFHASAGLSPKIAFAMGSLIWVTLAILGYTSIRKGNVIAHKKYMMYNYAGTFGAVTLRLWLPLLIVIFGEFALAYQVVAWLSWVPNLIIVYLYLEKREVILHFYKKYKLHNVLKGSIAITLIMVILSYTSVQTWFYRSSSYEGTAFVKKQIDSNSYFTKDKFIEIDTYLREESQTTSMLVLENGKIVFEYGDISEISNLNDAKISILSMLFGKYIEDGSINLNETIEDNNVNDFLGLLPIEKQATIDHLLSSSSGVLYSDKDRRNFTLFENKKRGSVQPGEYFSFNNWDYNVATYILEKKSGNNFHKEIEQQLAIPLEFQDWNIKNQSEDYTHNSKFDTHYTHLSTRDMAKIGQLMLQEGKWKGKQIIPKNWIKKITSSVIPIDTVRTRIGGDISSPLQETYGYLWWGFDRFYDNPDFNGAYTAWDMTGQFITVIPKRNVVVVHKTKLDYLTHVKLSNRTETPSWRYWWILRKLMLNRKPIAELELEKSTDEIIEFIKNEYNKESEYAISERLINEYGQSLADKGNYKDAIKFFELNLKLYPNHGYYTHRIYNYYGNSLIKLNRKEDALKAFEESLKFNADNPTAKKMIAELNN